MILRGRDYYLNMNMIKRTLTLLFSLCKQNKEWLSNDKGIYNQKG